MSGPDSASGPDAAEAAQSRRLRERYGVLFLALFVVFFVEGIASDGTVKDVLVTFLVAAALAISFQTAGMSARRLRRALVLVAIVVVAVVVAQITGEAQVVKGLTRLTNALFVGLAPIAVVVGVRRTLLRRRAVTMAVVLGALCLYLLVGLFFAFIYGAVNNLGGSPVFANGVASTAARDVYFSFTTLTTTGYGDITARSNLGHTLSALEMLIGQIYLVTVVAIVVGNLRPRGRERSA
jgi:Ion channel